MVCPETVRGRFSAIRRTRTAKSITRSLISLFVISKSSVAARCNQLGGHFCSSDVKVQPVVRPPGFDQITSHTSQDTSNQNLNEALTSSTADTIAYARKATKANDTPSTMLATKRVKYCSHAVIS